MSKRLKVMAVCGFGVGTSLILRISIEKVMKDIGVDAEVENADIMTASSIHADLIFTSQELYGQLKDKVSVPVVVIHNFLSNDEIKEKALNVITQMN